jgi:Archaeal/vacuolar-type H+-ATPase subunit F
MIGYMIGDSDMVTGFRLVGVEGAEAATPQEAMQALSIALARSDVGVIVISEAYFSDANIRDQVDKVRQEQVTPLIVVLPGSRGPAKGTPLSETISRILGIKL